MAVITGVAAGDMIRRLAGGRRAVMAAEAATWNNAAMIECRGAPACRIVAGLTVITALYMSGRLASRLPAVMTAATATCHDIMIHPGQWRPLHGRVTLVTHRHGLM